MWHIVELKNEPLISSKCAKELFEAQEYEELWYEPRYVTKDKRLFFHKDHYEWMDWLSSRQHMVSIHQRLTFNRTS